MRVSAISPKSCPIKKNNCSSRNNNSPSFKAIHYDGNLDRVYSYVNKYEAMDTSARMHVNLSEIAKKYPQYAIMLKCGITTLVEVGIEREEDYRKSGFFINRPNWKGQIINFNFYVSDWNYVFPEKTVTEKLPEEIENGIKAMQEADAQRDKILQEYPMMDKKAIDKALKDKYKPLCNEIAERLSLSVKEIDREYLASHPDAKPFDRVGNSDIPVCC